MGNSLEKPPFAVEISSRKIFEKRDIFVYAFVFLLILSLFLLLILNGSKSSIGFKVSKDDKIILSHAYGQDFNVNQEFKDVVTVERDGENFTVKIITENGYNLLFVNEKEGYVKMLESDCPSQSCVYMQELKNAGSIYCAPRELKISPLVDEFLTPTTGGVS